MAERATGRTIRLVKWALLLCGLGWAAYSTWGVWAVSSYFTPAGPGNSGLSNVLAGAQLFGVTLGPTVLAAVFLLIRWPAGQNSTEPHSPRPPV